jgi:agmatine deiminase
MNTIHEKRDCYSFDLSKKFAKIQLIVRFNSFQGPKLVNHIHIETSYHKPAEFERHARTWMIWPHRQDLYGERLAPMQREYVAIVGAIAEFEPVTVVAHPTHAETARRALGNKAVVVPIPVDDFWMRDCGPSIVVSKQAGLAGVSWRFNAWGGKHSPWEQDAALARNMLALENVPMRKSWLTCEGGSLALDGEGTLIVSETSILNPNRNPGVNKVLAESELKAMLGVEKVVWLPGDPMDKETDGHIDGMCAYVKPGTVMFETNPDPDDPHRRILQENLRCLLAQSDAKGRAFNVLSLEEAVDAEITSNVFCRSYINFYVANGGVIVPGYCIASDAKAVAAISAAYPDRKVVQIKVNAIAAGGGAIHCITQEQPALMDHAK